MIKLDIGSGVPKKAGYITIDNDESVGSDILLDILEASYMDVLFEVKKFVDGDAEGWNNLEIDEIRCHHLLEHLDPTKKVKIMRTLYDSLKPGGILDIEVPLFPHPASVQDPTHISFWSKESFWYFIKGNNFGEAFAKRHSKPNVPLFDFVGERWRVNGIGYVDENPTAFDKERVWAYGIKLRKPNE